jgi:hypothetical protein
MEFLFWKREKKRIIETLKRDNNNLNNKYNKTELNKKNAVRTRIVHAHGHARGEENVAIRSRFGFSWNRGDICHRRDH